MDELSRLEKAALLCFITYPDLTDMELSSILGIPNSTLASVKSRLRQMGYLEEVFIPNFPRLGFELLATVYSDFNPSVPVEERVANTRKTVEASPEVVLSMGESHRGFSISAAENITRIMRISNERLKILSDMNLLEIELPQEVYFPFEMSNVHRFFNLAPLIHSRFQRMDPTILEEVHIPGEDLDRKDRVMDPDGKGPLIRPSEVDLSRKNLEVLYHTLKHPDISASKLASLVKHSRHTISKTQEMLMEEGFITKMRIPDLSRLDCFILTLYHVKLDPKHPVTPQDLRVPELLQDDTAFFAAKPMEIIMLGIYDNYVHHNHAKSLFNQYLKANDHMKWIPNIRNHSLGEAIWIKRFETHELLKRTFGLKVR